MTLADLGIGPGHTRIVVEAGPCNGDLSWALDAVDAAADTGAVWGFKGQLYRRDNLVTRDAPSYAQPGVAEPPTQWEHFDKQLTWTEWEQVQRRCDSRDLVFFASVFDYAAVDWCENLGVPLYKIASADITHKPLLQYVAATGKPIVLSTGGATIGEITRAYSWIKEIDGTVEVLPLMCTLSYPTPPEEAHLARIGWWIENVSPFVGYSDHTAGISAMLTARNLEAVMIEKHFTITPGRGGDHDFAVNPQKLDVYADLAYVAGPNYEKELGSDQVGPRPIEQAAITNARRSIAAAVDIPTGTIITEAMLTYLRPGTGLYEPWQLDEVVGRVAAQDIPANTLIPRLGLPGQAAARSRITATLTVE